MSQPFRRLRSSSLSSNASALDSALSIICDNPASFSTFSLCVRNRCSTPSNCLEKDRQRSFKANMAPLTLELTKRSRQGEELTALALRLPEQAFHLETELDSVLIC